MKTLAQWMHGRLAEAFRCPECDHSEPDATEGCECQDEICVCNPANVLDGTGATNDE
jgi:hypothetical protein